MITDPRDIPNGFWLVWNHGITLTSGKVSSWLARGDLAADFVQSTAGQRPTVGTDGIEFADDTSLYESSALTDADDFTVFGLLRLPNVSGNVRGILSKWKTATADRSWMINISTAGNIEASASSDGAAASDGGLQTPGTNSNCATTPDTAALSITGDIDIRVRVNMSDWTPGAEKSFVSCYQGNAGGYALHINGGGTLKFFWGNGSATVEHDSSATVGATDGTAMWIRATLDVDNGSSNYDLKFWKSSETTNDPAAVTWTQIGSTRNGAATTAIGNGNQPLNIGSYNGVTNVPAAVFHRVQIRAGIGGTVNFDANFAAATPGATTFAESSSNGATVTVTGTAAIVAGNAGPTTVSFGAIGVHGWFAYAYRKSGANGRGHPQATADASTTSSLPSTLKNTTQPMNIGAFGASAGVAGTADFVGTMRHAGYFNRALTDNEMTDLLDWLKLQLAELWGGVWSPEALSGPYDEPPLGAAVQTVVFTPSGDAPSAGEYADWQYAHHTRLCYHAGKLFLMHSLAPLNEADQGQVTVGWRSTNGTAWSGMDLLMPPQDDYTAVNARGYISYPCAWAVRLDDASIVRPDESLSAGTLYAIIAIDNYPGIGSEAEGIGLFARSVAADGTLGTLFRITSASYTPISGFSEIAYDATLGPPLLAYATLYGHWGGTGPAAGVGSPEAWSNWIKHATTTGNASLTERSVVSIDGTANNLIRFWRQTTNINGDEASRNRLFAQRSYDGGVTWGYATPTDTPDATSASQAIRISDDRIALIGNPINTGGVTRGHMYLAMRADGESTWTVYEVASDDDTPVYDGLAKLGGPAYGDLVEVRNKLFFSYSLQKERIAVGSIMLAAADSGSAGAAYAAMLMLGGFD